MERCEFIVAKTYLYLLKLAPVMISMH